jgi:glycosyltransferase involved in cell wall biosynthesis
VIDRIFSACSFLEKDNHLFKRKINPEWYLKNNPDVAISGMSAEEHYKNFGRAEGRLPCPPNVVDKFIARGNLFFKVISLLATQHHSYWMATKILGKEWKMTGFQGLKHFVVKTYKQYEQTHKGVSYKQWLAANDNVDIAAFKLLAEKLELAPTAPLISVVMATYNTPTALLKAAIDSVLHQPYKKWELCIADDKSTDAATLVCLKEYELVDPRIKVIYREKNGHISHATNSALTLAKGDFVAFMDHDDELHPSALVTLAETILQNPKAQLLYSDEDKIDESGIRSEPHFKSDFNYELLLTQNYICHLAVFKTDLVKKLGGLNTEYNGAQDHDFVLRVIEQTSLEQVIHIPKVLYHWRIHSASTAASTEAKPYAINAGREAVKAHLQRAGLPATVSSHPVISFWHKVKFDLPTHTSIEIIIPTRDRIDLMRMCINSIVNKTTFKNYHITIIDNGSVENETLEQFSKWEKNNKKIRVLRDDSPFNYSRLNNHAARKTKADLVCLLNNDIEIITPDWLEEMAGHAMRKDVGCVGARLWYPNDTLQHGGVILGIGGIAGHSHKYWPKGDVGYMGRAVCTQAFSAVTAACLMIKRSIYEEVGGLDEKIKVAFNDVDFCLRVREAGYRNVWTPFAEMYHHESATRGHEDNPEKVARFNAEVDFMKARWGNKLVTDPFYSPNLTLEHEDFSYARVARGNII